MYEKELKFMLEAARQARDVILKYYNDGFHVEIKDDNSPVTEADKKSDALIRQILAPEFPTYGFLTEEVEDDLSRLEKEYVFIVDPVDGTKDFVARDDMFTTNIALSRNGEIVVGVVSIPAANEYYYAVRGEGSYKIDANGNVKKIHVNDKTENLTCLTSCFHENAKGDEVRARHKDKITTVQKYGSSIKVCRIAEGLAEIHYRFGGGTKERDTAAIQIILEEAGGLFIKFDKTRITYNKKDVYNHDGYIAINRIENFLI